MTATLSACASSGTRTPPPESTPTPCNGGSGLGDSCPPGPTPANPQCTTPKLNVDGQPFLSGNPALTEDAEYAAAATQPASGVPQVYIASTHDFLFKDTATNKNCIVRKTIDVWTTQNTRTEGG